MVFLIFISNHNKNLFNVLLYIFNIYILERTSARSNSKVIDPRVRISLIIFLYDVPCTGDFRGTGR